MGWTVRGSIPGKDMKFFCTAKHTDWCFGQPSFIFNRQLSFLPQWHSSQGMNLFTHLRLMPRLRIDRSIPHIPLHSFMVHTETMSPLPLPVMICVDCPVLYTIGKGVTSICKAGTPTGKILLTSTKIAIGRMDLQLNVGSKTMVNRGGVISFTFPQCHL